MELRGDKSPLRTCLSCNIHLIPKPQKIIREDASCSLSNPQQGGGCGENHICQPAAKLHKNSSEHLSFPFSPEAPSSRASPHAPASASEFSAATPRPAPALPGVQGWTFSQQLGHHLCQEEEFIPLFCLFKFCQRRALAHSEALS